MKEGDVVIHKKTGGEMVVLKVYGSIATCKKNESSKLTPTLSCDKAVCSFYNLFRKTKQLTIFDDGA